MRFKIVLNIILIILVFLLQFSFLSHFGHLKYINLPLLTFTFILIMLNEKTALYWTAGLGFLMEIYIHNFFGIIIFSFFITYFIIYLLAKKLFTNNSLNTLLFLGAISVIIFNLCHLSSSLILNYLNSSQSDILFSHLWLQSLLWQTLYQLFLLFLGFISLGKFSKKIKLNFLNN